jgi:RNA polymerase sigma factor (sigma-70 family)
MIFDPSEIRALIHVATKRTGTPVHDEDLEQEVALHALEAFRRLPHVTHPRALLIKIVYDTVRDHWRRKRSVDNAGIDECSAVHVPALESSLDHERRLELLRLALKRLPATKRSLLELYYVTDHSISEIAAMQGRSISAVKMELARSRQTLCRIFQTMLSSKGTIKNRR